MLHLADAAITDTVVNDLILFKKFFPACAKLSQEFDLEIIGRTSEDTFRNASKLDLKYTDFFDSDIFSREVSDKDIEDAEDYIGITFDYLFFSNKRRWSSLQRKNFKEKLVKYVWAWKELFKDTDIVINYMENLYFTNLADLVADKMGIKIIKVAGSGIVADGLILWDKDHIPIFYKSKYKTDALNHLLQRTHQVQTVKLLRPVNRFQDVLNKIPKMFNRISIRIKDKRKSIDVDIPPAIPEFMRVTFTALRYIIYPHLHKFFFDKSRPGEKFFLYPLHFQWEAQITLREPFLNQLKFAKQISKFLPHNTFLYVKIHPHWKNADQDILPSFDLSRESNVRLIGPKEKTIDLIKKSLGVIVTNSTVGYEALALGKPLVVTGHEVYKEVGLDVKDLNELPKILSQIHSGDYQIDEDSYAQFLKKYSGHVITSENPDEIAEEIKEAILWFMNSPTNDSK
ncbi:hypothetical protein KKB44_02200 [Candidatus Micrarchaeota archaeon]|nr:hypothetical protein [Candidatus Micrarchaeota archaeon]